MKPTVLLAGLEMSKEMGLAAYECTWVADLDMVPKAAKKQSFDLCVWQPRRWGRTEFSQLRQLQRSGFSFDLLVTAERDQMEKVLDVLGDRMECLTRPLFALELQRKVGQMIRRREVERENRFWRVELATLFADRESLNRQDIPADIWEKAREAKGAEESASFRRSRKEFERQCLRQALERAKGNQTQAAKALGIHRNTLIWKMKKLHVLGGNTGISRKGSK